MIRWPLACLAAGLMLLSVPEETSAAAPKIVPPLQSDGYLWAAPPCPTPATQLRLQFDFNYHADDFRYWGSSEELTFSSIQFLLSGEYTFLGALTAGLDVPFLMIYDVSTENDVYEDSGVDFGNIRLHVRYAFSLDPLGLVVTPSLRIWLPTNTYLEVDRFIGSGNVRLFKALAIFEPAVSVAWAGRYLSVMLATGPKFVEHDDRDDFSMWAFDLSVGAAPITSLPGLELVLELNMLVEMDDDMPHQGDPDDTGVPLGLGFGARYRFSDYMFELAFRAGLHDAEFYYGDFNLGLTFGWLFGA